MNKPLMWRGILILAVVLVFAWSGYPPKDKVRLGLDLQGGMHMVMRVKVQDALLAERDQDMESLRQQAIEEGLTGVTTEVLDDTSFAVNGLSRDQDSELGEIASGIFGTTNALAGQVGRWDWRRSGDSVRFTMTANNRVDIQDKSVIQAIQTIRNRIDAFGVAEPVIARQGRSGDRIVIQLPGVDDPERIRNLIKNTAFLEFRLVDQNLAGPTDSREDLVAAYGGALPPTVEVFPQDIEDDEGNVVGQQFWALENVRVITGRDLRNARRGQGQFAEPVVNFYLTPDGARKFGETTGNNVGRALAIVLDGKVQSAPRINSRITDTGYIEGGFDLQEAEDLSTVLRSGALPAGLESLEERTVGPSLGQDSIEAGIRAGLTGGVLVILLMLVVYKLSGINAVIVLGLNVILVFGGLALFGATLTVPGIAGIILTIGMAVDANVLIFERIREELRAGRTVKSAVDAGFGKALSSILDANMTTLIASLFLFQFGTGPIRGFAVTLSVGILASLFTAVFVSRFLFDFLLSRRDRVEKISI